jgi:hypothetical protein
MLPLLPLLLPSSLLSLSLSPLPSSLFVVIRSGIRKLGGLSIWWHHFPSTILRILLAAGRQQLARRQQGLIINAVLSALLSAAIVNHMCFASTR